MKAKIEVREYIKTNDESVSGANSAHLYLAAFDEKGDLFHSAMAGKVVVKESYFDILKLDEYYRKAPEFYSLDQKNITLFEGNNAAIEEKWKVIHDTIDRLNSLELSYKENALEDIQVAPYKEIHNPAMQFNRIFTDAKFCANYNTATKYICKSVFEHDLQAFEHDKSEKVATVGLTRDIYIPDNCYNNVDVLGSDFVQETN
jgi:hypothetical protein